MRKLYLLFLLFGVCLSAIAQNDGSEGKSRFKGGVRAGLTTSQVSGDDLSGFHKLGAYAGGFVNVPVSKTNKWKFQMEINFIMKGSTSPPRKADDPNFSNIYSLNLLYTETPFLVKYNIFKGLEIEAGPSINFLFFSREKNLESILYGRPPFRIFEFSFIGGVNYIFKNHWGISVRYSNSVIPVRLPTWVYDRIVKKQYNSVLAFSLYYQF